MTRKLKIDGVDYNLDDSLKGFNISRASSSNISWIGHDGNNRLFVQFHSGRSYFYKVDKKIMDMVNDFEGIQELIRNSYKLLKPYGFQRHFKELITA